MQLEGKKNRMATIPTKVSRRLAESIKRFQPILDSARARDVNESDTVTIVTDMLSEVFGYDKYSEVTSEFAIRGTYCDLAVTLNGKLQALIEVKAIGTDLKDQHTKQAVDYAANQGVDWVVLTNGVTWLIYKVLFQRPVDAELVAEVDFPTLNPRRQEDVDMLYLLAREGWAKSALGDYHTQRQALSRHTIGALLLADPLLNVLRRELKRLSPDVRVSNEQILEVVKNEVIKREVAEGEKADEAAKCVQKALAKAEREREAKKRKATASSMEGSDIGQVAPESSQT